jgi:two-component system, chemotaxis family, response regulator Rcp1
LRSAIGSSSAPVEVSGLNLSPDEVRHFSLDFQSKPHSEPASENPKPHIVLIEDSVADVGLVRESLHEHKVRCELTVIPNGELAVRFFEDTDADRRPWPDLVILDLNLPKKPGMEVLRRIRSSRVHRDVRVIVLTSSDNQKDREEVASLRPWLYLQKPSNLDEFLKLGAIFSRTLQHT